MVNFVKDIADKLEGYSVQNQGYALTDCSVDGDGIISFSVVPYLKDAKEKGEEETEHLAQMIERLSGRYTEGVKYFVIFAEKTAEVWKLRVKVIV